MGEFLGAYSSPLDPLAGLRGSYFKRKKEGRGKEDRERGEEDTGGKGRERKEGRAGPISKFLDPPLQFMYLCYDVSDMHSIAYTLKHTQYT